MATYAIGDVQGCFEPLQCLLRKFDFEPGKDRLWFAGDLVNRGPQSLEVLRFVHQLGDHAVTVLGNHDLHLIAVARGVRPHSPKDTFAAVLDAPDASSLIEWLCHRPLAVFDRPRGVFMSHAGLPPCWGIDQALLLASEVEQCLRGANLDSFLGSMYGDQPDRWSDLLEGHARLRVITNYFTRMRFCTAQGALDLQSKEGAGKPPAGFAPWFVHPNPARDEIDLLFGHWAALEGRTDLAHVHALDTGCVWGSRLRALRLEDRAVFHCDC